MNTFEETAEEQLSAAFSAGHEHCREEYCDTEWSHPEQLAALTQAHLRAAKQMVVEGRLIELDLLEQAINADRDMNTYKLQRLAALKELEAELKEEA